MSFVDTNSILEQRLKNSWSRTPIKWPNQVFQPPEDTAHNPQPYIAFNHRGGGAEDLVLGSDNPWYRWHGIVIINVFVPENIGMATLRFYGDLIKTIFLQQPRAFQYLQSGIIRLFVPQVVEVGSVVGWMQVNVMVPYRRDSQV